MKRFFYSLTLLLLALSPLALTSCDEDPWYGDYYGDWYDRYNWYDSPYDKGDNTLVRMSQMLSGVWTGSLTNEYTDNTGQRQSTNMYADFLFTQYSERSCNGRGTETDYAPQYDSNGSPLLDSKGNQVYKTQKLSFKWYIDPRTYNVYIEYDDSNYRFLLDINGNSEYSGFSLDSYNFSGVMEGVNNDEYVFFDLTRVGNSYAPAKLTEQTQNTDSSVVTTSFGKSKGIKRVDNSLPFALHKH